MSIWRPSQRLYQILNLQSNAPPLLPGENSGVLTIANGEQQQEKKIVYFVFIRVVTDRIHSEKERNLIQRLLLIPSEHINPVWGFLLHTAFFS